MKTKAGRDPEGAVREIEAQAQARSTCPVCGGAKVLSGPVEGFSGAALRVATIYCPKCKGQGTVPAGPQGELGTALLKASALKYDSQRQTQKPCEMHPEGERWGFQDRHIGDINWHCWPCLIAHLAAMPQAQPAGSQADLAAWQEKAQDILRELASILLDADAPLHVVALLEVLRDHLAAMPPSPPDRREAQPDAELLKALKRLMALIDRGVLVRDISRDDDDAWAMELVPLVQTLVKAAAAIAQAETGAAG